MRTRCSRNLKSSSWPTAVVRKWLNLKAQGFGLDADRNCNGATTEAQQRRKSCSQRYIPAGWLVSSAETRRPASSPPHSLRMFVGTWNVGGRAPDGDFNLRDWLMSSSSSPADIYVIGFQEIVPLNAGNVFGAEDRSPASQWLSLIRRALNPRRARQRPSFSYPMSSAEDREETARAEGSKTTTSSPWIGEDLDSSLGSRDGYRLVVSRQMVGIFLCVWVRAVLLRHVTGARISCVGRGILGYMGNKGSISISLGLGATRFCFVCTHVASGDREKHETRRNTDITEILKRTKFNRSNEFSDLPSTILEHDKVVWLGDLNYRLTASWSEMEELLQKENWQALLEKDQLKIEQKAGRVLPGWDEGEINFPPTYKYAVGSGLYAVKTTTYGAKSRNPAWCDRILWRGKGMKQECYLRGESRFSDHRPVYAIFSVELEGDAPVPAMPVGGWGSSSAGWGKVQAEEMLMLRRTASCRRTSTSF